MLELIIFLTTQVAIFYILIKKVSKTAKTINNTDQYLYAHSDHEGGLNVRTSALTAVATNFQTASVLFVGIYFGFTYGLTMLWTAITFAGGIILFRYFINKLSDEKKKNILEHTELPYDRIFGNVSFYKYNILVGLIYLSVLFSAVLEIWFGSSIVSELVSPIVKSSGITQQYEGFSLFLTAITLATLLFIYVFLGGYRAVALTDEIQYKLIWAMLILLLMGVGTTVASAEFFNIKSFLIGNSSIEAAPSSFVALMIGALFINLFWQFVDPQQWQRARASENAEVYSKSLLTAAIWTFVTWSVPIIAGAMLAGANIDDSVSVTASMPFLAIYNSLQEYSLGLLASILMALAAAGIIAAAVSSADTAVMAALAKISSIQKLKGSLDEVRKKAILITMIACIAAALLYNLNPKIENAIFAVYTAIVMFAGLFVSYVVSGGDVTVKNSAAAKSIVYSFLVFLTAALTLNFVPWFTENIPYAAFLLPMISVLYGFVLGKRTWLLSVKTGQEE